MPITISLGIDGAFISQSKKTIRDQKGKSLIAFPSDYTVIDLETTGLDPEFDNIIEISALRVRSGEVAETFSSLVKPYDEIDEFITELTGITNEMLANAPTPDVILPEVASFIGEDVVVGHNVNFDVNFLYDWFSIILKKPFVNDFIDTLRISRKALPELKHHRLADIAEELEVVPEKYHRALQDCETTYNCFKKLHALVLEKGDVESFINSFKHYSEKLDMRNITSEKTDFDETHPLYGKRCVFTGTLEKMTRAEAAQAVVDFGGICDNGITKKTNYLILGNNDYRSTLSSGKSNKQKKAESYKVSGIDIEIIPESVFYDLLNF